MKKTFTLFLCLVFSALLLLSPAFLLQGIHKNVYRLWEEQRQEEYTGNLTLWHIVSFKTGGETGVSYLQSRIRAFEKNHPYVFITLRALTVQEAETALAQGEFPDILSFPLGFPVRAEQFCSLPEQRALLKPYRGVGRDHGALYAYPYMADFYTLCFNQDALFYEDISLPFDSDLSADGLGELTESLPHGVGAGKFSLGATATSYAPLSFLFLKKGALSSEQLAFWQERRQCAADAFWQKESSVLLCPAAEARKAELQNLTDSFTLRTYAFSEYTDLCQLIGVCADLSPQKEAMCASFAASLLSASAQKALASLYLLPTTEQEGLYADAPLYLQEYAHMSRAALIPNHFALIALSPQQQALLASDAAKCREILQLGK